MSNMTNIIEYNTENYIRYLDINKVRWFVNDCTIWQLSSVIRKKLNVVKLSFNDKFCQSIDLLLHLENLEELIFGMGFNKNIDKLQNLKKLKSLTFGFFFNQKIDIVQYLPNLEKLKFGNSFNNNIEPL